MAVVKGAAYNRLGAAEAGMGVLSADLDGDLDLDLFMTHLDRETNTMYFNRGGDEGFEDASAESGVGKPSLEFTGFGTAALDLELDGDLDLVVANGRVARGSPRPGVRLQPPWDEYAEPNLLFLNDGQGSFRSFSDAVRAFCEPVEISRGLAVGDMDADGDLDLVLANVQGPARLLRNDAPRQGAWLLVRAVDPRLRRDAYGAVVVVTCGQRSLMRTITAATSYLSSSDPRAHFGLGPASAMDRLEVIWPDGLRELFTVPGVDRAVELVRGEGQAH
jgi:hypothetical protein